MIVTIVIVVIEYFLMILVKIMGGCGSGRWLRPNRKLTVEKCLSINISQFNCNMDICFSGQISWINRYMDEELSSIGYAFLPEDETEPMIVLSYRIENRLVKESINLQKTKPHFGGVRWWLTCPICERRMGKLFLPPKGHYFACRKCCDLRYRSNLGARRINLFR